MVGRGGGCKRRGVERTGWRKTTVATLNVSPLKLIQLQWSADASHRWKCFHHWPAEGLGRLELRSGATGTHNSCTKGQTKSTERWPCQQLLTPIRSKPNANSKGAMSGRFNQMGIWTSAGKLANRQTGQERAACVAGLTIGEISSKTIKNWQHKKRCWHIDLSGMLLGTAQMRPETGDRTFWLCHHFAARGWG